MEDSNNAPRVYKLAIKKQSESPSRDQALSISQQYDYTGNQKDLEAFLNRGGKYRLPGNQSEIQYAASLRNYKIVDYKRIAIEAAERERKLHPQKEWEQIGDL